VRSDGTPLTGTSRSCFKLIGEEHLNYPQTWKHSGTECAQVQLRRTQDRILPLFTMQGTERNIKCNLLLRTR
jgi:hypothetical protein